MHPSGVTKPVGNAKATSPAKRSAPAECHRQRETSECRGAIAEESLVLFCGWGRDHTACCECRTAPYQLSEGNTKFDVTLKGRGLDWGLREVEWVTELAQVTARSS